MAEAVQIYAIYDAAMHLDIRSEAGHTIRLDGDHVAGFSPMELLLASLAGCSGMSVISILQKKQEDVTRYEVHVRGLRAPTYPLVYVEIAVEHVVTGRHVRAASIERAIELAETRYCPVSVMLGKATRLTHSYRMLDAS